MFYNNKFSKLIVGLVLITAINSSYALKGDDQKPMQIDANEATLDQKNMVTVFSGNVVITKGSLVVHADKGTANQDKDGDRVVVLVGSPVTFQQTADDGELIQGQANDFNYNTKSHLAVLKGRARVKKGNNEVIGDVLTYNTDTQVYSAASPIANGLTKKSGGRITVILDQQDNKQNGTKNTTTKSGKQPAKQPTKQSESGVSTAAKQTSGTKN